MYTPSTVRVSGGAARPPWPGALQCLADRAPLFLQKPRSDHRIAAVPGPPWGSDASLAGRASRQVRNFEPGRQKSLERRSALCGQPQAGGGRRACAHREGGRPRVSGEAAFRPLAARTYSVRHPSPSHARRPCRRAGPAKPMSRRRRGEDLDPFGIDTGGLGPFHEGRARLREGARIPGPDAPHAAAFTPTLRPRRLERS